MSYLIRGEFLKDMRQYFDALPEVAEKSAMLALNQVAERDAIPMIRKDAESQVNFPRGYLDSPDKLDLRKKARPGDLEVVITARDRPTSLARFATSRMVPSPRGQGVTVAVKRGRTKHLSKAFLVRLKNGNIGLATRDKSLVDRAYKPMMLGKGVYLLYGPSVDQVVKTVAEEALPEIGDKIGNEFFRQFARLSRG